MVALFLHQSRPAGSYGAPMPNIARPSDSTSRVVTLHQQLNGASTQAGAGGEMAPARNGGSDVAQRPRSQLVRWSPSALQIDNGDIVIQGETRAENEMKEDHYYRMERRLGRFYRRVP